MAAVLGTLTVDMLVMPRATFRPSAPAALGHRGRPRPARSATLGELVVRAATMAGPSWAALRHRPSRGREPNALRSHLARARVAGIVAIALLAGARSAGARAVARSSLAAGVAAHHWRSPAIWLTGGDLTRARRSGLGARPRRRGVDGRTRRARGAERSRGVAADRRWPCVAGRFSRLAGVCLLAVLRHRRPQRVDPAAGARRAVDDRLRSFPRGEDRARGRTGRRWAASTVTRSSHACMSRGRRSRLARVFRRAQLHPRWGHRPGSRAAIAGALRDGAGRGGNARRSRCSRALPSSARPRRPDTP